MKRNYPKKDYDLHHMLPYENWKPYSNWGKIE